MKIITRITQLDNEGGFTFLIGTEEDINHTLKLAGENEIRLPRYTKETVLTIPEPVS